MPEMASWKWADAGFNKSECFQDGTPQRDFPGFMVVYSCGGKAYYLLNLGKGFLITVTNFSVRSKHSRVS